MKQRLQALSPETVNTLSHTITEQVLSLPVVRASHTAMLYYPMPQEVNTLPLLDYMRRENVQVLLPAVTGAHTMEARIYNGSESLLPGAYGIMEPVGEPFEDFDKIDFIIVPGLAFDPIGNRMGHGKGYYDRFLSQCPFTYKLGICFDFQILEHLPTTPMDIQMNGLVTDKRSIPPHVR